MNLQRLVPLAPYTTFGIGGPAEYFVIVHSKEELHQALRFAKDDHLAVFVLGLGANILVSDEGVEGMVIKNEMRDAHIEESGDHALLHAGSGAVMSDLIEMTVSEGWSGLEHYAGIPSTVGGALWQNLHFLGPDRKQTMYIGNILDHAEIVHCDGEIVSVDKTYFGFSYDYSTLHDSTDIVVSASFVLERGDTKVLRKQIAANLAWREKKHPYEAWKVSAGSVFKKIEGVGAGRLIEQAGLKGYRIGGAQVSDQHANFIINTGGATAADVRSLIQHIQNAVYDTTGYRLEPEIRYIGKGMT
jgi:UDP-N-acetylmuramate dehydrogenase